MNTAEKFEAIISACKGPVEVFINQHTSSYMDVNEYFDRMLGGPDDADAADCVAEGAICEINAYINSPVGCMYICRPTFADAVDRMHSAMGLV